MVASFFKSIKEKNAELKKNCVDDFMLFAHLGMPSDVYDATQTLIASPCIADRMIATLQVLKRRPFQDSAGTCW
jgi:hypothetical protein